MPSNFESSEYERALRSLAEVVDPEVGENVVDLGLVERLEIDADSVTLTLVLTSPTCPMGDAIADDAFRVLQRTLPNHAITIELAEHVQWRPERMSEAARERLGWSRAPV